MRQMQKRFEEQLKTLKKQLETAPAGKSATKASSKSPCDMHVF
jgi:hypothetical protein